MRCRIPACHFFLVCYWNASPLAGRAKRTQTGRIGGVLLSSASQITFTDHLHCSEHAAAAVRRRSAKKTMQAATLVALLIPVVAIWITVVVRYGRSIEDVTVASIIKKEE